MTDEVAATEEAAEKTPDQIAAEQQAAAAQVEVEARATRMGWTPQDKFRGDPSKWVDAKTFVERGETMVPIMRERLRTMEDRFSRQEQAFGKQTQEFGEVKQRLTEITKAFGDYREFSRKSEERAFVRAKTEVEAKMAAAAAAGDTNAYHVAKGEMDRLDATRPEPAPPPREERPQPAQPTQPAPVTPDPEVLAWVAENQWFERDQVLKAYATAVNQQVFIDRPGISTRDNLAEVKRLVMERFPEKFGNTRRDAPPAVAAPTAPPSASRKKGKTFEDIPAADRAPFAEFKRWMPDYKKEDFAAEYFAGDEG